MGRKSPEEIAELIVWGVENAFVAETVGFLVDRLTSIDYRDYDAEYWVRRMANENPVLLNDIYLKYKDKITAQTAEILEPYLRDLDTEKAMQEFSGHYDLSPAYSASTERLTNATVKGCTEIIQRQNVALIQQQADAWYEIASVAVTRENATMMSEREIIADAVKELSARQITTIDYKSGAYAKIDVAIRRHIVTQVNQNYLRLQELRANEYDWDLFSCSSHPASRPEHFHFQGCIFSKGRYIGQRIDGEHVYDYRDMDIGSVTGIYGANCSHYTTPYIPGLSQLQKPPYDAEENEKRYDLTQKQRYYERQIRATKAEIHDLEKAGLDTTQARLKLGQQQTRVREFCQTNNLTRDRSREIAYGIGEQPRALRSVQPGATSRTTPTQNKIPITKTTTYTDIEHAAVQTNPNYKKIQETSQRMESLRARIDAIRPGDKDYSKVGELYKQYKKLIAEYKTVQREWGQNCQRCTVAYELRRRGYDVTAKKRLASNDEVRKNWRHLFINQRYVNVGNAEQATAIANLEGELASYGEGSRSIVYVKWRKKGAHVFIAEVTDDGVLYVDPQSGIVGYDGWQQRIDPTVLQVARVDDKEVNLQYLDKIVEVG